MRLLPPDLNSKRSRFADWLEVLTLLSDAGQASTSQLRSLIRRATDDRLRPADIETGADNDGEPEVTDRAADDLEERLVEELIMRSQMMGEAYPFELASSGVQGEIQILKRSATWSDSKTGKLIYTFCLLDSAIRDGLISIDKGEKEMVTKIGNVFQICSCIAVGGYTDGEVVSFGFPRATGDAFLPALQAAWKRYGAYEVRNQIPHGFDAKLKDGGIDIIAWRPFEDGHAATFLMFVQVASGLDWKDKPVSSDVAAIKKWFVDGGFEHFTPAICMPFPIWFDLEEPPKDEMGRPLPYVEGVPRKYQYREGPFGVIFDRGRMALSSARALSAPPGKHAKVDGIDRIGEVRDWTNSVISCLAEKRSTA